MNHTLGRPRTVHDVGDVWSHIDAAELYEIERWGQGYFSIGDNGHVRIHPTKEPNRSIDLKQLVDHLQLRGIHLPTLIRFSDILRHRLKDIHDAFANAIAAQRKLWLLQGDRNTWFCGAYFGAGFHEDGLQAGLAVAEQLGHVRRPWQVPNESGRIVLTPRTAEAKEAEWHT